MKRVVYVTGNPQKAKYFSKMVGVEVEYERVELTEIQSLSLREIVEQKVKTAYEVLQCPVLVEDTKLSFTAMGALPGPLIKWFIEEMSFKNICHLLDSYEDRTAFAGAAIAYYDGHTLEVFERELVGTIARAPKGDAGFGWNPIFIPKGANKTLGEMNEAEFERWYGRIKPFDAVGAFLKTHL